MLKHLTNHSIWNMEPDHLRRWVTAHDTVQITVSEESFLDYVKNKESELTVTDGGVAVIGICGAICQHFSFESYFFGYCACEILGRKLDEALSNDKIGAILLMVDSPGGESFGVKELADRIYAARSIKPITAIANSYAASAGYYLASAAKRLVMTPGGLVGSIGTYLLHWDHAQMLSEMGVKPTFIQAGDRKTEGNPYEALDDDALAHFQSLVNVNYKQFVADVARYRGTSQKNVLETFGQGRVYDADRALKKGMVDAVMTYEAEVERLTRIAERRRRAKRITAGA